MSKTNVHDLCSAELFANTLTQVEGKVVVEQLLTLDVFIYLGH